MPKQSAAAAVDGFARVDSLPQDGWRGLFRQLDDERNASGTIANVVLCIPHMFGL
jgi:hypothetical protein